MQLNQLTGDEVSAAAGLLNEIVERARAYVNDSQRAIAMIDGQGSESVGRLIGTQAMMLREQVKEMSGRAVAQDERARQAAAAAKSIADLAQSRLEAQKGVVERLVTLVKAGTDSLKDLDAEKANLLLFEIQGRKDIHEAETAVRLADVDRLAGVAACDARPVLQALLDQLIKELPELSDVITRRYLSHLQTSRHLAGQKPGGRP